jgi:uncharacterized protein (DUF58 family)
MTARGICLLFPALVGTAVGLLNHRSALTLLSLATTLWLIAEWAWFQWRLLHELSRIRIRRTMNDQSGATHVCFAGRPLRISLEIEVPSGTLRPWTRLRDTVPGILAIISGRPEFNIVTASQKLLIQYKCCPKAAGEAHLTGVRIRIQDANGFFHAERFVECRQVLRILPAADSSVSVPAGIKRINGLPQHGIHRLQRAGMGSELLELREYAPGDPPKSIAWKVSARRDRLMTRQYESEVPIRTVVFVEDSHRTQNGPWGERPCDVNARLAANFVQSSLSGGDPVGLVRFNETRHTFSSPGWGDRTRFRILEMLSNSCRVRATQALWSRELQDQAMLACRDHYPHLLDAKINHVPWTLFPLLPWNRNVATVRSRLAGVVCQLHDLTTSDWVRLVYDDELMGDHLSRLLNDVGRPFNLKQPGRRSSSFGMEVHSRTVRHLIQSMQQTIGRARDNEHYVIICNLIGSDTQLNTLRPVVQLACGRHHRVGFICPLPVTRGISGNGDDPPSVASLMHEAWHIELHEQRQKLARKIRSWGAEVAFADQDRPMSQILRDLHLLRSGRTLTGGLR